MKRQARRQFTARGGGLMDERALTDWVNAGARDINARRAATFGAPVESPWRVARAVLPRTKAKSGIATNARIGK